jgi:tRNA(Ile)-lysidine synthase TilS/MesJ
MPLSLQDFERTMKRLNPSDEKMIVALSGGIDSMLLVELLLEVGAPIELAHVNFQLRGEESEADEQFVAAYAKKKKTDFARQARRHHPAKKTVETGHSRGRSTASI